MCMTKCRRPRNCFRYLEAFSPSGSIWNGFGSIWKFYEYRFRWFVFSVSKRCESAKTISFQMLPNSENSFLVSGTLSWWAAHIWWTWDLNSYIIGAFSVVAHSERKYPRIHVTKRLGPSTRHYLRRWRSRSRLLEVVDTVLLLPKAKKERRLACWQLLYHLNQRSCMSYFGPKSLCHICCNLFAKEV